MRRKTIYFLYFLFDGDEVVYIGLTKNLKTRMARHKDKIYNSAMIKGKYKNRNEGLGLERKYTVLYRPKYSWIPNHLLNDPMLGSFRDRKLSEV
jgi:hypothetical protein